jgi:predicted aspartyl protease
MKTATYSNEYFPAAPTFPISIAVPGESPTGNEIALIDTGADGTFVPLTLLEKMDLPITYETNVRSHLGDALYRVSIYTVDLILFDSIRLPGIKVVGDDWGHQIIIGRNVLNLLQLHLDGPRRIVKVEE